MDNLIRTLTLRVSNAYLLRTTNGFVLIDTGFVFDRKAVESTLADAGCGPDELRLVVITHADPDHVGTAAFLRDSYRTKIAMHRLEVPAVEQGDMFLSRGPLPPRQRLLKPLRSLFRLRRRHRFTPDLLLEDGDRLTEHGLEATVLHVPGHTRGSIAILTDEGDLFCGDLLENRHDPALATFVDDADVLKASFDRLKQLDIQTVHPGHGEPFRFDEIG